MIVGMSDGKWVSVRVSGKLYDWLQAEADERELTVSALIRSWLAERWHSVDKKAGR
jgi:predicted DNA-binding ribbon-helix-helix protein